MQIYKSLTVCSGTSICGSIPVGNHPHDGRKARFSLKERAPLAPSHTLLEKRSLGPKVVVVVYKPNSSLNLTSETNGGFGRFNS